MASLQIARFRKERGMTQQELARTLGISRSHLSRIENGHEELLEYLQHRMVKVLNLHDDDVNILLGAPAFRRRISPLRRG